MPGAVGPTGALYLVEPADEFLTHDLPTHGGQEIVYVLEGSVELAVADRMVELGPGDCAAYEAGLPHRLRRRGGSPAAVLVMISAVHPGAPQRAAPLPGPFLVTCISWLFCRA